MFQEQVSSVTKEGLVEGIGLLDAAPFLDEIGLFDPGLTPTPDTLIAAFAAALPGFTGYARQVATWAPNIDANGFPVLASSMVTFTAGDPLLANGTVAGVYVTTDGGKSAVYAVLDNPVAVNVPGQVVNAIVKYRMNGTITIEFLS